MAQVFFIATLVAALTAGTSSLTISDRGDCTDIMANNVGYTMASGRYNLLVGDGKRSVMAYCDMTTDGGGWTVIQRRVDKEVDFYQDWAAYEKGFGNINGNYWLGLTYIHSISINKRYVLRIEVTDWNNKKIYAEYDDFHIGGAGCNYTLTSVGNFCGDCGDSLAYHVGSQFSTKDRDNDESNLSCAQSYLGGWWYKNCLHSNLNGEYKPNGGPNSNYDDGLIWHSCSGYYYSYKTAVMMIRPYYF